MKYLTGRIFSLSLVSACAGVQAAESTTSDVIAGRIPSQETGFEGDHLTGQWGGLRTKLVDRGVHLYAGYTGEVLGNVSGGRRRGAVYDGLLELAADIDTEKLGLWKNGLFHISSIYPHGPGFSARYTGDLLTASNIDAFDSFRLYELWYQHTFFDGRFSLRLGQLLADDEFAYTESGGTFINSAFGWPAFISGNTINTGPAFYVATPGVRLRLDPNENWFVQSGIYDGDSFDSAVGNPRPNASGTRIHLSSRQGLFSLSEAGYLVNSSEESAGLPGEYKLGFWMHTADFPSNFHDRNGNPFIVTGSDPDEHSMNYGAYLAAQQMVWRKEDDRGISLFARVGGSPGDRNLFELVVDGGITARGLLPGREKDTFGIGYVYARLSRDIRRAERLDATINGSSYQGFSDHESVLEFFYSAQLTKWWTVQPDFQWIFNPGGNNAAPDAVVLGFRSSIVF